MDTLFHLLFGCRHRRLTLPQTPVKGLRKGIMYCACVDCGAEFAYDWRTMRTGARIQPEQPIAPAQLHSVKESL